MTKKTDADDAIDALTALFNAQHLTMAMIVHELHRRRVMDKDQFAAALRSAAPHFAGATAVYLENFAAGLARPPVSLTVIPGGAGEAATAAKDTQA